MLDKDGCDKAHDLFGARVKELQEELRAKGPLESNCKELERENLKLAEQVKKLDGVLEGK